MNKLLAEMEALEERFLKADEKTGIPQMDQEPVETDLPEDEFDEVEMMMDILQSSTANVVMLIDSLLRRGHKDKLIALFGQDAEELLKETRDCLDGISELFGLVATEETPKESSEEKPEEAPEEEKPEEKTEEPAEEPETKE